MKEIFKICVYNGAPGKVWYEIHNSLNSKSRPTPSISVNENIPLDEIVRVIRENNWDRGCGT